ncbi:MAG: hypothetical protein QOH95_2568 [Gaiellaceae bacterium]|nr:hypothetical protein [Gaiellaceae bacterium]
MGLLLLLLAPGASASHHPLRTGLYLGLDGNNELAYQRAQNAGTTIARSPVSWMEIAPTTVPAAFNARDPADPAYNWTRLDAQVRIAVAHHLAPLLTVYNAPVWAQDGTSPDTAGGFRPDPSAFADFATAIATRYDGLHGQPRVRYWEAWNEPNVNLYLSPQFSSGGLTVSPTMYRALLNRFAAAVHAVHAGNVVVAGGLSPFTVVKGATITIGPMRFMRELLCMSAGAHPHPTCSTRTVFDAWSHHPYTSGNATHQASNPNDASLGDLPEMRTLLDAAYKAGHIVSPGRPGFWVTEYSWDTKPPDPGGVPLALHARWVSESLYRMWQAGVDVAIWLQLVDEPFPASPLQAGLYSRGAGGQLTDRPKPALKSFTFPFVAYTRPGGAYVWGRTPWGKPATVVIERRTGSAWRRVGTVATDRFGVFERTFTGSYTASDWLRARIAGNVSLPLSLRVPADLRVDPFGA